MSNNIYVASYAQGYVKSVQSTMPELPEQTRARLLAKGLSERDVHFLMTIDAGREVGFDGRLGGGFISYFDEVATNRNPKVAVNWRVGKPVSTQQLTADFNLG